MGKDNTLLEIKKEEGNIYTGNVLSSDHAELKGKRLLKDVKLSGQAYVGQLFVPRLGKWVTAKFTVKDVHTLLVAVDAGLASRTVEWVKQ